MSFGFSVGDFLAVAQLAYTLFKALLDSKGAVKKYKALIELNVVHKVLLQVDQLRAANQLEKATIKNALLFTVNATNVVMETFFLDHEGYEKSLRPGGSGNSFQGSLQEREVGHSDGRQGKTTVTKHVRL
jgi:hypothetical protein